LNRSADSGEWFVSLDLEMTGIDPEHDEIIEIGAIRFTAGGRSERYQTLVNPGRPLPYRIRTLTGISDEELQSAPPFAVVAETLRSFLGADPIVGQHVGFDLMYLQRMGLRPPGPVWNTAELAELLAPGLPEYSLRGLTRRFGIDFPTQHRALPDAEAAMQLFLLLRERALALPPLVLAEIVQLSAGTSWPLRAFFASALQALMPNLLPGAASEIVLDVTAAPRPQTQALQAHAEREPLATEEIRAVFDCIATHPQVFGGFEQRPQQVEMAEAVTQALSQDEHLLVEAGTGTGKSLAYLLPAACFALRNGERVVVSTNTINLQEQITGKDLPALRGVLAACGPDDVQAMLPEFRAVQLKGRGNYLCLQRFANFRRQTGLSNEEARFAVRLLLWLQTTETGDRAELNLRPEEEPIWARLSAANSECFNGPSYYVRNGACQLLRARKRAEAAHLVVVNHALLLSDISAGGRVLPPYERLIVDEAHNLEEEATDQFGFTTGLGECRNALNAIDERGAERESGLLADVAVALRLPGQDAAQREHIDGLLTSTRELTERARERVPELFGRIQAFVAEHAQTGGEYDHRLLLTTGKRSQPGWQEVELAWENLRVALDVLQEALGRLGAALTDSGTTAVLDAEGLGASVAARVQSLTRLRLGLDEIIGRHDAERIAWLTVNRLHGAVTLASAPLNVGEVLESYLFGRKSSVVLTSATLSAAGSFRYVRERLGLEEAEELALGSPFDYRSAALVLTATDMPEPNRLDYQPAVERGVIELTRASEGRALVLFTSHGALRATYRAVRPALEADGIRVLAQGVDGTPRDLLDALKADHRTVLLGTASFWEGVDLVGEALSLLIIAKLPFPVPTDPVFAARSELFDAPFKDYALPQAALRFKQGFGRLIRQKSDRGVLAVLDRRIRSKTYGKTFLASLPDCTQADAPLAQLPTHVRKWLRQANR